MTKQTQTKKTYSITVWCHNCGAEQMVKVPFATPVVRSRINPVYWVVGYEDYINLRSELQTYPWWKLKRSRTIEIEERGKSPKRKVPECSSCGLGNLYQWRPEWQS